MPDTTVLIAWQHGRFCAAADMQRFGIPMGFETSEQKSCSEGCFVSGVSILIPSCALTNPSGELSYSAGSRPWRIQQRADARDGVIAEAQHLAQDLSVSSPRAGDRVTTSPAPTGKAALGQKRTSRRRCQSHGVEGRMLPSRPAAGYESAVTCGLGLLALRASATALLSSAPNRKI